MKTLDIHNKIVSEAEIEIDLFLKESYFNRELIVLIIHGHGTYALKDCVQVRCALSDYVKDLKVAPPQLGGSGASMVYIRTRR